MLGLDVYVDLGSELVTAWRHGPSLVRRLLSAALILVSVAIIVAAVGHLPGVNPRITEPIAGALGALAAVCVLGILAYRRSVRKTEQIEQLQRVERRVQENPQATQAAWELAQAKLEIYLNRNLNQVRSIYWLTVAVLVAGFSLIGYGVYKLFADPQNFSASVLSAASGVLVNFVGASFLVVYRATMVQAKDYVTILERINAVGMAVQILESLGDGNDALRSKTTAEIAKQMLDMYTRPRHQEKAVAQRGRRV